MCEKTAARLIYIEKQRGLFNEAHVKGFTNTDIAGLLGLSVGYINNCATCQENLLSGPQIDEFARKCGLTSVLKAEAEKQGYVLYALPRVEQPADTIMAFGEVKREEGEDCQVYAEILRKLKSGKSVSEADKAAFEKECLETIAERLKLIASVKGL